MDVIGREVGRGPVRVRREDVRLVVARDDEDRDAVVIATAVVGEHVAGATRVDHVARAEQQQRVERVRARRGLQSCEPFAAQACARSSSRLDGSRLVGSAIMRVHYRSPARRESPSGPASEQLVSTHETSRSIRERLGHPVVDIDGHCIEFFPGARALPARGRRRPREPEPAPPPPAVLRSRCRLARVERRPSASTAGRRAAAVVGRAGAQHPRPRDRAVSRAVVRAARRVRHRRQRHLPQPRARLHASLGRAPSGAARAARSTAATRMAFAEYSDRLVPVAAIPMHTPDEAIDELEYAVNTLGFKAVLLAGYVQRPVAAAVAAESGARAVVHLDRHVRHRQRVRLRPVWQKCVDLGVSVAFHSGSIGWGSRSSISNYMYNHLGHLAEGQHALCEVAVPRRRDPPLPAPQLRVPRRRRRVGRGALRRSRRALGEAQPSSPSSISIPRESTRRCSSSSSSSTAGR